MNYSCIGIAVLENVKAEILNNLIYDCHDSNGNGEENKVGIGIYVESIAGIKIFGNIIYNCYVSSGSGANPGNSMVWAPNQGVLLHNNCLFAPHWFVSSAGGVVKKDCFDADPKPRRRHPNPTSASTRVRDPQYNDRDGSRKHRYVWRAQFYSRWSHYQ